MTTSFDICIFKRHVFDKKARTKISYRNRTLKTCQILKLNVVNVSDSEVKNFQRVTFSNKVFTPQGVGFQIKFFGACQSLIFGFLTNISFAKQKLNTKKNWFFLDLYKRQILHSVCFSHFQYSDWKFLKNQFLSWKISTYQILNWLFFNLSNSKIQFLKSHGL